MGPAEGVSVIVSWNEWVPRVDPAAWVAASAVVAGRVSLAAEASLWYGVVVRADRETITIGPGSNVQDGCVLHADPGYPLVLGRDVVVGHRAVLHGCRVEDECLIGIGAIVMNGAVIGSGSIVGAGALVPEGMQVPARSLVLGIPGRVRRATSEDDVERIRRNAAGYRALSRVHAAAG
jgi:carbonic anhydrase/acetyltransferase-like protein (isoleucine patch superfamily)